MSSKEVVQLKLAESIASMVTEYVEGGLKMAQDWRPGLARMIQLRIERLLPEQPAPQSVAAADVLAERLRQVKVEGWTPLHDDEHDCGDLAAAACAYALYASDELNPNSQGDGDYGRAQPEMWPFHRSWWKPEDPRRALVKAGALILAEIERIDRKEVES